MGCSNSQYKAIIDSEKDKTSKLEDDIKAKSKKIIDLENNYQTIENLFKSNEEKYNNKINSLQELEVFNKERISKLEAEANEKSKKIIDLENNYQTIEKLLKSNEEKYKEKINSLQDLEVFNKERISKLEAEANEKSKQIIDLENNYQTIEKLLKSNEEEYKEKISSLQELEVFYKERISKLEAEANDLENKNQNIEILLKSNEEKYNKRINILEIEKKELEAINKEKAQKLRVAEEQQEKLLSRIQNKIIERGQDLSIKYEKKKRESFIEMQSEFEVKPIKQMLQLFLYKNQIEKPKKTITYSEKACEPDTEYQKRFISLHSYETPSYKTDLNIKKGPMISIERTLPKLVLSEFNIVNKTKFYNSESAQPIIFLPSSDIESNYHSIQSDSLGLFKLPETHYLNTATKDLIDPLQSPCISKSNHYLTFNPENIFKYWSKYNSFKPVCSLCSSSNFYQFWSCQYCSLLICPTCKPIHFECPKGHSYSQTNLLKKFSCSSCLIEKVTVSLYCEPCSIQLCCDCALLRNKAKFECENSHKMKYDESNRNCSLCAGMGSIISCDCSSICQACFEYIESPVFYHPGVSCEYGHLLHVVEKFEKCSVCKHEKEYLYYCKDCSVFVCDLCADSYVKALYAKPLCKKMHRLEVDFNEVENKSIKGQVELKKFYCELCDEDFSLKEIPAWGKISN